MPINLSDLTPSQLAERRDLIIGSFGRIDKEFDRRRGENRLLVKAEDIKWESASRVHPTTQEGHLLARIISPELGFNIHTFRVFKRSIAGKETDGAFHTHGDAVKFYLEGKGKEIIDKEEVVVEPGDMAFIPGNVWHGTENTGDEPMVFIAFHQIPGTQLPVPASWQYPMADMEGQDDLDDLLNSTQKEDPPSMGSAALYSRRQHFLHELGVLDEEMDRRRQAKRWLVRKNEVPWELLSDSQTVPLIAPELGFNIHTLQLSIRLVPPGYKDTTFHSHGEAVHYFLAASGRQTVGKEDIQVSSGDLVFIPAGVPHGLHNSGDEVMRVLVAEQLPGTCIQRPVISQDAS